MAADSNNYRHKDTTDGTLGVLHSLELDFPGLPTREAKEPELNEVVAYMGSPFELEYLQSLSRYMRPAEWEETVAYAERVRGLSLAKGSTSDEAQALYVKALRVKAESAIEIAARPAVL